MYRSHSILAVIPARGGSKGIPLKNLRALRGVPLVTRAALIASQMPEIDCTIVSTDHPDILSAAAAGGAETPFLRPAELSGDRIADIPVLRHALTEMEAQKSRRYDIVLMLQPTSPLRRPEQIRAALDLLIDRNLDAVWSVTETDSKGHPLKQLVIKEGLIDYYDSAGGTIIARQQLKPVYHKNGVVYAFARDFVLRAESVKGERTGALVIDDLTINIDTPLDLEIAEFLMAKEERA